MSELQSMTGFARASAEHRTAAITWEVKSVNGRGLEVRFRLPPGYERIEQPARQALQKRFSRGNVQASLTLSQTDAYRRPVVDEVFLKEVAELAGRLHEQFGTAPATADGLLALRGVLDYPDPGADDEAREAMDAAILETFEAALAGLDEARRGEGAALAGMLLGHVQRIEALTAEAEADPSRTPEMIRARLKEQVARLMDATSGLDETRLHMEAAFLATKADIREEIDRLNTHVASARALIAGAGAVGRKLDFLGQEFNREANTLCSKSNAASVTAIGLELKAVVDQFREQVQNLE
ncbi:YicC/YloC family endoribonuclease [Nitratireductor sp. ZSWI3]|uniref:YicC/YloC family endoribonuclease n=1 Tax=Nitratireductor sp. ZSWI3 TaxID=2966359 RepID=UPI00214FE6EF|nr:YicC/YloC family endoribonuclease [Nitratireductor sp. ZSWI3]MCR4266848.1 YicC family protein [Nitratireductor sp. ZSWI3]